MQYDDVATNPRWQTATMLTIFLFRSAANHPFATKFAVHMWIFIISRCIETQNGLMFWYWLTGCPGNWILNDVLLFFYPRYIFPREVYKLMKMTERYDAQSVQSGTGRLSCSRTARCTSTETLWYEWLVSLVSPEIEEILLSRSSLLLLPSVDIFPRGLRKIEKKLTNRYDTQSA